MHTAQILGYPLLLLSALEIFLGILLLRQNPRNSPVNKATAACAFAAALWSLSAAFMYIRVSLGMDFLFFARASWIGWFTVPTAIQTVLFLRNEQSRKARLTGYLLYPFWTVVLFLCLFTDLVVTDGYMPIPYRNSPGPLEMYLRLAGSLMVFWLIYEIARLRRLVTGYRRSQLSYYLYGTVIFGTGGAVIGGILQLFTGQGLEPSLSAYTSFPWVLMIFYAISRHRLFDIRLIFSRTMYILLLSLFISALQFEFFKILEPVVGAVASIFISVPLLGGIFFATPLSKNVQRWINDLVLGGRYQYQKMLKESANAMITILHRDELLRYIVESVRRGLGVTEALLYLKGPNDVFSIRHSAEVNEDVREGRVLPHTVVQCLRSTGQPIIREELAFGELGEGGLVEAIGRMESELVLPLISKGQMLGVLTLGKRQSGEPYLQSDIDVLQTVAGHAAVAIENAHLFEDAGKARADLRESENVFRTLAETTTAGIFIIRPDRILYVNNAGARMCGYGIDELLTMDPWVIIHPEYRSATRERGRAILQGQQISPQNEFKFITKEGGERWALSTSAVIELQGEPALITTLVDVTDLKRVEEDRAKLYRENEKYYRDRIAEQERFAAVLSASQEGFWISNLDDQLLYVNDAYCKMTGYSRDELLTKHISDLDATMDNAAVEQHTKLIKERGYLLFEATHRKKGGGRVDLEVSVNSYPSEGLMFSFFRDITERKKAEVEKARLNAENLRFYQEKVAEQERFASVLRATSDGFCITGNDTRFLFVNDAWCLMLGYTRDEMLSLTISDVNVELSPDRVQQVLQDVREKGHALVETRHRRKDGTTMDVEISINYYHKENVYFSFFRDISERKRAEEALRRSDERFRQVTETAQEWIWEVDRDGRYTYSSPVITALLGYEPGEVVGKRFFYDFFVPEEREQLKREAFQVFAKRGSLREYVNRNLRKDGKEVVLSTSGMPILDNAGNLTGYRGADFDITKRIRAEQERNKFHENSVKYYQALLDEQRRHQEEKEKILKDLHDGIGGLTTNINLLAELARKNDDLQAVRGSLATISDLSRESLSEIRSFIQSLDAKELSWQTIAAEFRSLGNTIVVPHGVKFSLDAPLGEQIGGPNSTISMNLFRIYKESLANVIKHAKASTVNVSFVVGGGQVVLDIHDNGIGLDGRQVSGRGLSNMQSRAREMGGSLAITSDKGTRVRLELPIP